MMVLRSGIDPAGHQLTDPILRMVFVRLEGE